VKIDGRSFAPQLLGKQGNPRKWVYNQFEGRAWIRTREWKLYRDGLLFDMKNDPEEKNPIRPGSDSDHSAEMRKKLEGWLKGLDEG
jgi:arylsulfatase A